MTTKEKSEEGGNTPDVSSIETSFEGMNVSVPSDVKRVCTGMANFMRLDQDSNGIGSIYPLCEALSAKLGSDINPEFVFNAIREYGQTEDVLKCIAEAKGLQKQKLEAQMEAIKARMNKL